MSSEELEQQYALGYDIFKQFFDMNDSDLRAKLIEIVSCLGYSKYYLEVLEENSSCFRIIRDSKPEEIKFVFYSSIKLDWSGIKYNPEHGSEYYIVKFNKFFKL